MRLSLSIVVCCAVFAPVQGAETGRILLLDNHQIIEGDIRREGGRYLVRLNGGETSMPAERVLELLPDRHAAYLSMRERCNLRDPDERMRLIRWCMDQQLRPEAIAEGELLLRYRPDDNRLRQMMNGLKELEARKPAVPVKAEPVKKDAVVRIEVPDYNPESFTLFVTRVQPILMNACVRCHANNEAGSFSLVPTSDGSNRKATLQNLAITLKQLNRNDPSASPLLTMAVTPHGKATLPPLRERQGIAFGHLETWARMAVPDEPARLPEAVVTPAVAVTPMPVPVAVPVAKTSFGETSKSLPKPEVQREAKDPFDPAIFNGTIQRE